MFRWLLIFLILWCAPLNGASALEPSSVGPAYPEEAGILWRDGKSAFGSSNFDLAIQKLTRLVDRYPGYDGYLEAHYLLGKSLAETHKHQKALEPLKYYIEASIKAKKEHEIRMARICLARSLIELKKFSEAYLVTKEIEKNSEDAEMLLIRTQALLGLNHDERAERTLHSATTLLRGQKAATEILHLRGEASWLELKLKVRNCERPLDTSIKATLPAAEGLLLDNLAKRGTCLLETMTIFYRSFDIAKLKWIQSMERDLEGAFTRYAKTCWQHMKQQELLPAFKKECVAKYGSALDLTMSWKKELSKSKISASLKDLISHLEKVKTEVDSVKQ
ncbi:MAG: tetratricopeptide repeat protein [Bdellovibrionota bacterium]